MGTDDTLQSNQGITYTSVVGSDKGNLKGNSSELYSHVNLSETQDYVGHQV